MPRIEPYAASTEFNPPTYAQAVKVTGAETILFLSGQVAYAANGGAAHAGDFKAQARAALQAVKAQVEAGGGTMADIVKVNTYITDIRHRADYAAVRGEFFVGKDAGLDTRRGDRPGAARIPDRDRGDRDPLAPHLTRLRARYARGASPRSAAGRLNRDAAGESCRRPDATAESRARTSSRRRVHRNRP
jgi:2-iminobutanoate/2-iminopropanoate deaminase